MAILAASASILCAKGLLWPPEYFMDGGNFGRAILPLFSQRFCGIVRGKGTFPGRGIKWLQRAGSLRSRRYGR
jgi:hypothetical protein